MRRITLAMILGAGMISTAHAENCMDTAKDQIQMTQCAAADLQSSDATLNKLFQQIRQRLADDPKALGLFRDTQRAWIAFRDAECSFAAATSKGGSIWPMVHDICLNNLTKQRIAAFEQYLHCEEGDTTCPVPRGE
ncbi:DUF1311 domain-containing protein (plasmid) [Paracoccus methylovorus]|uniref:DUF1311 domain-containing protein n=1 Tax=Paracoccus methylovorus TaxID=2812658 RepID=A0ABX7JQD2_9RHOB|nr:MULTISPECIES: lysozyme inhibitor LprI family protein [Paracoccus]QRZ16191.1 DUF1311 domain-containing protein [Paracoccus methylovorus]